MNVDFNCPHCGRELSADARHVGRRVRCPDCATLITVTDPAEKLEETIVDLEAIEAQRPVAPAKPPKRSQRKPPPAPPPPAVSEPAAPPMPEPPIVAAGVDQRLTPEKPLIAPVRRHNEDLIDMTAMVDIVFFLLIFFLVTSMQALEAVMNLPTPQASEGGVSTGRTMADLENDPNAVIVRIEDDDSVWVEDEQVFSDNELTFRLRSAKNGGERRSLLVLGDADASHGAAVRVFDAGAAAGIDGISFIVQEKGE
jgi:biopolymer transport protein ExbD